MVRWWYGAPETFLPLDITHVVWCGESAYTNLYVALARGCWVVTQHYMLASAARGAWVEEEEYGFRLDLNTTQVSGATAIVVRGRFGQDEKTTLCRVAQALGLEEFLDSSMKTDQDVRFAMGSFSRGARDRFEPQRFPNLEQGLVHVLAPAASQDESGRVPECQGGKG